jgi:hypothetical protein
VRQPLTPQINVATPTLQPQTDDPNTSSFVQRLQQSEEQ